MTGEVVMMRRGEVQLSGIWALLCFLCVGCAPPDPGRPTALMYSRQTAAMYCMSQIRMKQMAAREQRLVDQDQDGIPEFCLLGELAGELVPRGRPGKLPMVEPYLPSGYKTGGAAGQGFAERKGYCYVIYLAKNSDQAGDDKTLGGTGTAPGPAVPPEAIDLQEKHFALYAWPTPAGTIPKYAVAFFINEKGRIYHQKATNFIGRENVPPANAAYSGRVFTSDIDTTKWTSLYGRGSAEK